MLTFLCDLVFRCCGLAESAAASAMLALAGLGFMISDKTFLTRSSILCQQGWQAQINVPTAAFTPSTTHQTISSTQNYVLRILRIPASQGPSPGALSGPTYFW